MAGVAFAQSATENVTVTAARTRQALDGFVQSVGTPTRMTGKLARWEDGICPRVLGLGPALGGPIAQRVRDVAKEVGAPVNAQPDCKANIEIVFTTTPQAFLDDILKTRPALLGYHDTTEQEAEGARVIYPIQGWYLTQTIDIRGKTDLDVSRGVGAGFKLDFGPAQPPMWTPARVSDVTGNRLGDGLRSAFNHILIVADPRQLTAYDKSAQADYIAMISLTQLAALSCQPLASIVNLLPSGCLGKTAELTDNDIAYLTGLYRMRLDGNGRVQQDDIAFQMEQSLKDRP